MFNLKRLAKFLATGEMPEMTALDESLAEHDKMFHPEGFREGDFCLKRKRMSPGDNADVFTRRNANAKGMVSDYRRMVDKGMAGGTEGLDWLIPILSIGKSLEGLGNTSKGAETEDSEECGDDCTSPAERYLALVERDSEDASPEGRDGTKRKSLADHDARWHPDGFDPKTDQCKYRDDLKKGDQADTLGGGKGFGKGKEEKGIETVKIGKIVVPKQLLRDISERDAYRANDPEWTAWYQQMEDAVSEDLKGYGGVMTYQPNKAATFLKSNDAYPQGSIDFVDICVKREMSLAVLTEMLKKNPNWEFSGSDLDQIVRQLASEKLDFPCTACFVEHKRQQLGKVCKQFIDALNGRRSDGLSDNAIKSLNAFEKEHGVGRVRKAAKGLSIYHLAVPEGNEELFATNPMAGEIYEAFVKFNNARGTAVQELFDTPTNYRGELKIGNRFNKSGRTEKVSVNDRYAKKVNDLGGIRFWSKSDFDAKFIRDVMAIVKDGADLGVFAQAYTKRDEFAWIMRNTGVKILRSGIPKGVGYSECDSSDPYAVEVDGKHYRLEFDGVEGINFNSENVMDSSGHPDIGCNVIGVNELQMKIAQKDPRISQIIPLHGHMTDGLRRLKNAYGWKMPGLDGEFKKVGTFKNGAVKTKAQGHMNFYTDVLNPMIERGEKITERSFVERYLEVCKKRGLEPRCPYGLNKDRNGNYVYTPGYSKYLADGKFFEYRPGKDFGKYYPQKPIRPNFNAEEIHQAISNRASVIRKNNNVDVKGIADRTFARIANQNEG